MTINYLAHLGYGLTLSAFVTRDILLLRSLLIVAQLLIITYAWRIGVPTVAGWNTLFAVVNTFWVVRILRERRAVVLPADLRVLYERHFAALSPPEFLRWWRQGDREVLRDESLARAGEFPPYLYFLMSGTVRVSRAGAPITDLTAGFFVAEMSLLTGKVATADADAIGQVDVMRWAVVDLTALREGNPMLWTRIQSVIGHDLVEKIQRQYH